MRDGLTGNKVRITAQLKEDAKETCPVAIEVRDKDGNDISDKIVGVMWGTDENTGELKTVKFTFDQPNPLFRAALQGQIPSPMHILVPEDRTDENIAKIRDFNRAVVKSFQPAARIGLEKGQEEAVQYLKESLLKAMPALPEELAQERMAQMQEFEAQRNRQ